jgi:hypothetical protein
MHDTQRKAAELQDPAVQAHRVAGHKGSQDHLTGPEHSRQEHEHQLAHGSPPPATAAHGVAAFGHDDIAALAYELWNARGCPEGSPEEDWFHAAEQLRSRAHTR